MPDEAITTPAAAEAEIASKLADPDFQAKYENHHHDDHAGAVAEMARLHRIAVGEDDPPDDKPADKPTDAVDDAALADAEAAMESHFGSDWREKAALARDTARRLGGQQGLDTLVAEGRGNDMEAIGLLVELGERDKTFPAVALVQEILGRIRSPDQARLELRRRMEDGDFVDAWLKRSHLRHEASVIEMRVLQELADGNTHVGAA